MKKKEDPNFWKKGSPAMEVLIGIGRAYLSFLVLVAILELFDLLRPWVVIN